MNRRGFALLAALWIIVALGTLGLAAGVAGTRGARTSINRITLTRAEWGREACVAILEARFAATPDVRFIDSTTLGRGTWCRVTVSDPAGQVNVNAADPSLLRDMLGDSLTDALLDWRDSDDAPRPLGAERSWYRSQGRFEPRNGPLVDPKELELIRGFESDSLRASLTTRGSGSINLNLLPDRVLSAIPGLTDEAVELIRIRRQQSRPLASLDEVVSAVSPFSRDELSREYRALSEWLTFTPTQLVASVEGGVRGAVATSAVLLTLVPIERRLAVIAREPL